MNELWPIIRYKFTSALSHWHPSDPSALEILKPWKKVFKPHEWDQLCSKSIEPKLSKVLETELKLTQSSQDIESFHWVMAWDTEIRPEKMANLLDVHFFPKWRAALRQQLGDKPDFDEIARWYLSWKSFMSDALLEIPLVAKHIEGALNDMDMVVSGHKIEPTWTPAPTSADQHPPVPKPRLKASQRTSLTLKELVAQFAEDSGVDFIPKVGRLYEGFQVYHFGLVLCIIDTAHESILAQMDPKAHEWRAVSLDELLYENDKRLKK